MSRITFAKELFCLENINVCCNDFKDYAVCIVSDIDNSYVVELSECRFDESETIKEFENYLIELTFRSMNKC